MKYLKQFILPIAGLEIGSHQYAFHIDGKFFESYEESDVKECSVDLALDLRRQTDLILLTFHLSGSIRLICDRCLDPFDLPVAYEDTVVLKFMTRDIQPEEMDDETEYLQPEQQEIDIRQHIYDFIALQVPFRKVHPDDENGKSGCDEEVLRKINELSVKDHTDPRWDQLKDLQNN